MKAELEALVDKHGLANVLLNLSQVCSDKNAHIEEAWQEDGGAWLFMSVAIDGLSIKANGLGLT